jgi:hypothetical protein
MRFPFLPSRIEQSSAPPADRIISVNLRAFILIAGNASEPQVFFNGLAASGLGNDMIDGQLITDDALIGSAVATAMACHASHALTQSG